MGNIVVNLQYGSGNDLTKIINVNYLSNLIST